MIRAGETLIQMWVATRDLTGWAAYVAAVAGRSGQNFIVYFDKDQLSVADSLHQFFLVVIYRQDAISGKRGTNVTRQLKSLC